jgi:ribosomal protein S18 acetylase RimI-like enzyme
MSNIEIRDVVPSDKEVVQGMLYELLLGDKKVDPFVHESWIFEAQGEEYLRERIGQADQSFCIVADRTPERQLVGTILGKLGVFYAERPVWRVDLEYLYVSPEVRHQGIGSALLNAAYTKSRSLGASIMSLEVYTNNTEAVRLYEQEGFTRICHIMQKDLWTQIQL